MLEERPNPDPDTITFKTDDTAAIEFTIIFSGAPISGEVRFDVARGMCIFFSGDVGTDFLVTYKGAGSNLTVDFLKSLVKGVAHTLAVDEIKIVTTLPAQYLVWVQGEERKMAITPFDGTDVDQISLNDEGTNAFSNTVDTADKINLYVVGSNYTIQNKTSGAVTVILRGIF